MRTLIDERVEHQDPRITSPQAGRFLVWVLFTDAAHTSLAMRKAVAVGPDEGTRARVIVPFVVPYPLPLEWPPITLECCRSCVRPLHCPGDVSLHAQLVFCRDRLDAVRHTVPAGSPILIGPRGLGWFSADQRLIRRLRRAGFPVLVVLSAPKESMLFDLFYGLLAILFFAACWAFTKACDRL